jgi:hypothetical protein
MTPTPSTHRRFRALLRTFVVVAVGSKAVPLRAAEPPKLNIVYILADDLGYGDVGCYNPASKIPTPNIDRLAGEGVRFTDAHAPSAVCNDFHGVMDDTYRTGRLIPHSQVRYTFAPHMIHQFAPDTVVTRPLWFDQHLKKTFVFPATAKSELLLPTADHVPEFRATPDRVKEVIDVHIYYSIDPDPRARFWRSTEDEKSGERWTAKPPILSVGQPLFAFVYGSYPLPETTSAPRGERTKRYTLSTLLHTADPKELKTSGVVATHKPDAVIDDGSHPWRAWYGLEAHNPHHWEFSTRELNDPKWQGKAGQRLTLELQADEPNVLVVVLTENFFRSYRGKQREFTAVLKLVGGKATQTTALDADDFVTADNQKLASWEVVDVLSLRAYHEKTGTLLGSKNWARRQPVLHKLWWQAGK